MSAEPKDQYYPGLEGVVANETAICNLEGKQGAGGLEYRGYSIEDLAGRVSWIESDITVAGLPEGRFDVWHDRAVFHFLMGEEERARYVAEVRRSVRPGGHVIVATFGPEGPTKCSGLDVVRYDADSLHREFGVHFHLLESVKELHQTPFGTVQQFLYCHCKVE